MSHSAEVAYVEPFTGARAIPYRFAFHTSQLNDFRLISISSQSAAAVLTLGVLFCRARGLPPMLRVFTGHPGMLGKASTRSFASLSPSPVLSRTTLIASIFWPLAVIPKMIRASASVMDDPASPM